MGQESSRERRVWSSYHDDVGVSEPRTRELPGGRPVLRRHVQQAVERELVLGGRQHRQPLHERTEGLQQQQQWQQQQQRTGRVGQGRAGQGGELRMNGPPALPACLPALLSVSLASSHRLVVSPCARAGPGPRPPAPPCRSESSGCPPSPAEPWPTTTRMIHCTEALGCRVTCRTIGQRG